MKLVDLGAQRRRLGPSLDAAVLRVLDHQAFVDGPEVEELEHRLAGYCDVDHVVTCSSGTDAIVLSLLAIGVRPAQRVAVPAFTYVATAEAVVLAGATPVFVDVDEACFTIEPGSLRAAFAEGDRTGQPIAGVIPVDLFGQPAGHDAIAAEAGARGAWVLTDAAQSFGCRWRGRRTGAFGRLTATSFFPAKPLGCYGDGGAVLTNDADLAARLRSLRNHGTGAHRHEHVRIGMTGRLDTVQAAVLLEKLRIFDDEVASRRRIAERYTELLAGTLTVPRVREGAEPVWAQYTCRTGARDRVAERLRARGVPTAVHYRLPVNRQPAYRSFPTAPGGTPVAEALAASVLSLPLHPYLSGEDVDRVAAGVRSACAAPAGRGSS
jgi:dTDP-4-amino-4,6-dideoxygalactose transaminase